MESNKIQITLEDLEELNDATGFLGDYEGTNYEILDDEGNVDPIFTKTLNQIAKYNNLKRQLIDILLD